jgi:hypothetical protein
MTIGVGTFLPSARFAFPRSYVYEIVIARYGDTITQAGMTFTIHAVPPDPTVAVIVFNSRLGVWTSNRLTLDFCVNEFYALPGGVGPAIPLNYTLSYTQSPTDGRPCLQFEWYITAPDFQRFKLTSPGSPYWLPPPL